jgi:hypothetical protein
MLAVSLVLSHLTNNSEGVHIVSIMYGIVDCESAITRNLVQLY